MYKYGTADTLTADTLTADTLTADTLTGDTLTADTLTADTLTADKLTADTLTQEIFNFLARRQRAVKCKMALTSQQRGWCVLEFHKTHSVVTVQRALKRKFNVDPPTNKSILK